MANKFISGNDAFAYGIALSRPHVISAYPITPQTTVVETLSSFIANGTLNSEFIHVESEHSALSAAIGASSVGARAFTATSSQGLLYMAECLTYASGGRYPIVMMNANRSTALPWNIYGDQRDSISLLDHGWIQAYAEDAQEALDLAIMSFYIAEHKKVSTPFMVNLDGFALTHTYEVVDVPEQEKVDEFLPPFETDNKLDLDEPKNLDFSAGPDTNTEFKYHEQQGMLNAYEVISECEQKFKAIFKREYPGLVEDYYASSADFVIVTLGTIAGTVKDAVDTLRSDGKKVGLLRLRYLRPFPNEEIVKLLKDAKAVAVLEKDISFGNEGTVYTNVNSALKKGNVTCPTSNYIGGLGGRDIEKHQIIEIFERLTSMQSEIKFIGLKGE